MSNRITNEEQPDRYDRLTKAANEVICHALDLENELAELRAKPAPPLGSDERAALREYIDVLNAGYDKASAALEGLGKFHTRAEIEREMQYRKRAGLNDDGTWSDPPQQPEREDVPVEAIRRLLRAFNGTPDDDDLDDCISVRAWLARREGKA